jgi:hypothetical protein
VPEIPDVPSGVVTDDDPSLAPVAAKWAAVARRAAELPPARCDVCGAVEAPVAGGRTRITHDEAKHVVAAKAAAELLERPRRAGSEDDDVAPFPHLRVTRGGQDGRGLDRAARLFGGRDDD